MLRRLWFLALLTLSACGTNVTVGEKHSEQTEDPDGGDHSVACGTQRCAVNGVTFSGAPIDVLPCCYDETNSACGIAAITQCYPLNDKGNIDSSCPSVPNLPGIGTILGCCRPDNTCGLYDGQLGFGCAKLPDLFGLGSPPPFLTCVYKP